MMHRRIEDLDTKDGIIAKVLSVLIHPQTQINLKPTRRSMIIDATMMRLLFLPIMLLIQMPQSQLVYRHSETQ
jgi:hypothetical protein